MNDSQIVHHNPCFNLFILHNNSFDNQGSEINKINKNDTFYVSTYCLLQKLSSWLSPLREWSSLAMAFTGKFIYIYIHTHIYIYILLYIYILYILYIYIYIILYIRVPVRVPIRQV